LTRYSDLRRHAQLDENRHAAKLADAQNKLSQLQTQISQLMQYRLEFTIPDATAAVAADAILFAERLDANIKQLKQRIPAVTAQITVLSNNWQRARTKRLMLETLLEREEIKQKLQLQKKQEASMERQVSLKLSSPQN